MTTNDGGGCKNKVSIRRPARRNPHGKGSVEAAGEKNVLVMGGANIAQQFVKAGLVDEIQIQLVPVLLGAGTRLFDNLGADHIELERTMLNESPHVTHLRFRVVRGRGRRRRMRAVRGGISPLSAGRTVRDP
ncbi:dihydrofolate reductase family protein [Microbispora catharanthi]|uniref:Bacterial bifunctional deaminase-reductase C-terminal domain-containing protein n=1 Tax=Microbispora catharanthi TaxID=1712871 RepID=A0A5N6BIK1_9ACTN|nr:dihydrofolate reductase family protein [Microbispora catharanthi]KAB8180080.1 hypothetical protein FH610_034190 [Microbispora catharanthi]